MLFSGYSVLVDIPAVLRGIISLTIVTLVKTFELTQNFLGVGTPRGKILGCAVKSPRASIKGPPYKQLCHRLNYTVSQKTSYLSLAITLIHVNGFCYFLSETLLIK